MRDIKEKDLYTIEKECRYTDMEEIQAEWSYDNDEFDDTTWSVILWRIFTEKNPKWITHLQRFIKWNKNYPQEIINFCIYWAKYKKYLTQAYNDISSCVDKIDSQKDDIEDDIKDAIFGKQKAENEYYDLAAKIESATDDSNVPDIQTVDSYTHINKIWDVDTSKSEVDEYDISSWLDDMDDWKDDWHKQDDIISDYTDLLEIAKENLEKAKDFQGEVEDWMYDY